MYGKAWIILSLQTHKDNTSCGISTRLYGWAGEVSVYTREVYTGNRCLRGAKMEVIIIDSLSHCWEHLFEIHSQMQGNSFTNWGKITPRQTTFVQKILNCNSHVISTMRTKQEYVLNEKNGKFVPEKVGLKTIMRDGIDYAFTIVLDMDLKHFAKASKDRTNLFMDKPEFIITPDTGKTILDWCNEGKSESENLKAIPIYVGFFSMSTRWKFKIIIFTLKIRSITQKDIAHA